MHVALRALPTISCSGNDRSQCRHWSHRRMAFCMRAVCDIVFLPSSLCLAKVRALQCGRILVVDEFDKAPTEVVCVLKSLLEDAPCIYNCVRS